MAGSFRFTFGPWNIHEGADPFGPPVRNTVGFDEKLARYKELGFDGVQLHDDDAVPNLNELNAAQIEKAAIGLRKRLGEQGLEAEFVAPRLWEDPRTIDGAYTANNPAAREYAKERTRKTIDIAQTLGTNLVVLWFAREGTYIREAKDSVLATQRLLEAVNDMLDYAAEIRIAIEPKPNEPMDQAFIPTTGHAVALGMMSQDPGRVGVNIESAHAILAGLDPSEEMGFALASKKLFTVHLNDQNGLKFDEDKSFGSANLRSALNQVRVLDRHDYGIGGEWVGLDVKAMRTQPAELAMKHLANSRDTFLRLLEVSRGFDERQIERLIGTRDYEELDAYVIRALIGPR